MDNICRSFALCMAWVRRLASSFTRRLETWVLMVLSETKRVFAISLLDNPLEIWTSTSYSRLLMPSCSTFLRSIELLGSIDGRMVFLLMYIPTKKKTMAIPEMMISMEASPER